MATGKRRITMDEKVSSLLKQAEELYMRHFDAVVTGAMAGPSDAEMNAAIFGYLCGIAFSTGDREVREIAYNAMQKRFGWDDEFIATSIIGG